MPQHPGQKGQTGNTGILAYHALRILRAVDTRVIHVHGAFQMRSGVGKCSEPKGSQSKRLLGGQELIGVRHALGQTLELFGHFPCRSILSAHQMKPP